MSEKDIDNKIDEIPEENDGLTENDASEELEEDITEDLTEEIVEDSLTEASEKETSELDPVSIEDTTVDGLITAEADKESTRDIEEEKEDTGIFSTLLSVIGNVIFSLFLILLMSVVALNIASFLNGDAISVLNRRFYIVGEDSMYPIIKENDAIIVEEKKAHSINDGDLIVYETIDGNIVTGWVTKLLDKDRFEIKKDINSSDSVIIDGIAIVGIASLRIKNMGDFIEFISKPISLVLILAVGIVIYMLIWFVSKPKKRLNY